jgi:hypothetical protein
MAGRHQQGVGIAGCPIEGNGDNDYLTDSVYFAQERLEEGIKAAAPRGADLTSLRY